MPTILKILGVQKLDTQHYRGSCTDEFLPLAHVLSEIQAQHDTQHSTKPSTHVPFSGAAVAVYFRGQQVAELYSGYAQHDELWQPHHIGLNYSTGKAVLSTLVHILASCGQVNIDQPIADYWADFAQNDKHHITLRHVLSHQSGLFDIRHVIDDAQAMLDWQGMLAAYAEATPRFLPNQATAYQAISFGWLVGGALEHATGRQLTELLHTELVMPLDMGAVYFGVPASLLHHVAVPYQSIHVKQQKTSKSTLGSAFNTQAVFDKALKLSGYNTQDGIDALLPKGMSRWDWYSPEALQACIPAVNGVANANSLAKMYAMLAAGGTWNGQQYIRLDRFADATQIQTHARDRVMPVAMHWRLGYHRIFSLKSRAPRGFGHIGYNGSGAWCDPSRELSFAYVHNRRGGSLSGDYRLWWLTETALSCADKLLRRT